MFRQEEREGRPRGFRRPGERCEGQGLSRRRQMLEAGQMGLAREEHM